MAQNRDKIKDETLELSVPTDTPHPLSCPICPGPDPARSYGPEPSTRPRSEGRKRPAEDEEGLERESGAGPTVVERKTRTVNRCSGCKKRVGLTGFRCRCGDLFCSEHRYSDRHDCSYDYKSAGREAIARENPVVRAAKLLRV